MVIYSIGFWENAGLTLIGGGMLLNDPISDLLDDVIGAMAFAASGGIPPDAIASQMSYNDIQVHGDPGNWRYDSKKPGSGVSGRVPGDVNHYEYWINEFGRRIEVHYFTDAAGRIKEQTIKLVR